MARLVGFWMLVLGLAALPIIRLAKRSIYNGGERSERIALVSHPDLGPKELKSRLEKWGRKVPKGFDFESFILALNEAERRFGVDADLLLAVAAVESAFDTKAVSSKNAQGLFQIQPPTAEFLWNGFCRSLEAGDAACRTNSVAAVSDVRSSTLMAAYYLAMLRGQFLGHTHLALASYNVGPAALRRAQKDGQMIGATYVYRVYAIFRDLKNDRARLL
jgi:hypothetical protein